MPIFAAFAVAAPELLAVEAAAATAAEIAAAEAATVAAAEAAAATAAQQAAAATAAQTAATTASAGPAGIMELGNVAANAPLTPEAVNAAAQQANAGIQGINPAQQAYMEASTAANNPGIAQGVKPLPAYNNAFPTFEGAVTSPVSGVPPSTGFEGVTSGPQGASPGFFNPTQAPGQGPLQYQLSAPNTGQGIKLSSGLEGISAPTTPMTSVLKPPSALESGMNSAIKFAKENPFTTMTGAYGAANMLGLMKPSGETFGGESYDGPLSKYRLSDDFQAGNANPEDFQYTPKQYATGGGIMSTDPYTIPVGYEQGGQMLEAQSYAKGGSLSESIESYQKMLSGKPQAAPSRSADVGIYYDQDPDTRYQDALTAAQIRQAKVNQRAYVSPPAAKRPTPMGQLQMASVKPKKQGGGDDVEAASGGIMHSSLGGYASGGNPRLLKGPGDGMSDNIPATINGRQPARLADGEFVIPADVVSHLGNGSTEAGAKQLHAMMDKVRSARTGNKKQGKNINPKKYMPK
jgi:hypothetical protein